MSFATAGMTASREVPNLPAQEKQHFSNVGLVDYRQNFHSPAEIRKNFKDFKTASKTPQQPHAWVGFSEAGAKPKICEQQRPHIDIDEMAKTISSDFCQNLRTSRPAPDSDAIGVKFAAEVVQELKSHMDRQNQLDQKQKKHNSRLSALESNVDYLASSIVDNDIDARLSKMEKKILSAVDSKLEKNAKSLSVSDAKPQQKSLAKIERTLQQLETVVASKTDKKTFEKRMTELAGEIQETQNATLAIGKNLKSLKGAQPPVQSTQNKASDFINRW